MKRIHVAALLLLSLSAFAQDEDCPNCRAGDPSNPSIEGAADALKETRPSPRDLLPVFHENFIVNCSLSQIQMKGKAPGGSAGHAVTFIKGACRDSSENYPKLKVCDAKDGDRFDKNAGVTLSVDKAFANTRFIATDGIDMMFNGEAKSDKPLTGAEYEATIRKVVDSGAANGIKLHDVYMKEKPAGMSDAEAVARKGIGTDFALSFGRVSDCLFLPIEKDDVARLVEEANRLNAPFTSGKQTYQWNGLADNCTHFTDNLLASIGVGKPVGTGNSKLRKAKNFLSIFYKPNNPDVRMPKRSVVRASEAVTKQMPSPVEMIKNGGLRKKFEEFGSLPQHPGALVGEVEFLDENELYNKAGKPNAFDPFKRWDRRMIKLQTNPRTSKLEGSLLAFNERMKEIEKSPRDFDAAIDGKKSLDTTENRKMFEEYWTFLERERQYGANRLKVVRGEMSVEDYKKTIK